MNATVNEHDTGHFIGNTYNENSNEPNVIIFGSSGKGKSSLVNLLAKQTVAEVSDDASDVTFEAHCFEFATFNLWDTRGYPDDPAALIELVRLIRSLKHGVSLLITVIPKGRVLEDAGLCYRLVYEFICRQQVPSMLVVTKCETDGKPGVAVGDWVDKNKASLQPKFPGLSATCMCGVSTQFQSELPETVRDAVQSREAVLRTIAGVLGMNVVPYKFRPVPVSPIEVTCFDMLCLSKPKESKLVQALLDAGMQQADALGLAAELEIADDNFLPMELAPSASKQQTSAAPSLNDHSAAAGAVDTPLLSRGEASNPPTKATAAHPQQAAAVPAAPVAQLAPALKIPVQQTVVPVAMAAAPKLVASAVTASAGAEGISEATVPQVASLHHIDAKIAEPLQTDAANPPATQAPQAEMPGPAKPIAAAAEEGPVTAISADAVDLSAPLPQPQAQRAHQPPAPNADN